jgi:streptogramin lyase
MVTDRTTGAPIANASIFSSNICPAYYYCSPLTTTDGNGNYSLTAAQINNLGTGTVFVQVAGYFIGQQAYAITTSPTTVNVTLLAGGTLIQGSVTDASTQIGIVGASVGVNFTCNSGYCTNDFGSVNVVTSAGGQYVVDSSMIYEVGLAGLRLSNANVSSVAYFTYSASPNLPVTPPYPLVQNFSLIWTGLSQSVTVTTDPTGLSITVDGVTAITPQTYAWVPGNEHAISTPTPQSLPGGGSAPFAKWSDGGQLTHIIVIPNAPETVTATFDIAAPIITPQISGTLGTNGWYVGDVSLSWSVVDSAAPVTSTTGCTSASVTIDTTGQTFTCSATGLGGSSTQSVTIKRDTTPPVVSGTLSPLPDAYGWNSSSVTVTFTGTDSTSGIASCSSPVILSAQGANQSASGSCTDNAGNVGTATVTPINIEETPPTVSDVITDSVPESPTGWYTAPVTVTFTGIDALSGVAPTGCAGSITLSSSGAGQVATGMCTNLAGDVGSLTVSGINIDLTIPVATYTPSPPPNAAGWNNTPVTVTFSGTDSVNGSGIANCTAPISLTTTGAGQLATGTCTSVAGTVSAPVTDTVNINVTPPTIVINSPPNNAGYPVGATLDSDFSCFNELSVGTITSCIATRINGGTIDTSTAGPQVFSVTATDDAGNTTTVTNNYLISSLTLTTPGSIWTLAGDGVYDWRGDGGPPTAVSLLNTPNGVAADAAGNVFIADTYNKVIRRVDAASGTVTTVAGNGTPGYSGDNGPATAAQLDWPYGIVVDAAGNLYIADEINSVIRRVDATSGYITTVAGNGTTGYSGDRGPATAAQINDPYGVTVDVSGNIFISDSRNGAVRRVDAATGIITTVAGNGTYGYSGDGGPAANALLYFPTGITVDTKGNLYIADYGNHVIRRVDAASGNISTISAAPAYDTAEPEGVALDAAGNLYISDIEYAVVWRVDAASGVMTTVVGNGSQGFSGDGGLATSAELNRPWGISFDGAGNLYIADSANGRIRLVPGLGSTDTTPPVITHTVTGTLGLNGWYTSNVTVTWSVTDPLAPIISQTGCGSTTISADTAGQTITCSAVGQGGTSTQSVTIKRDSTLPIVNITTPANGGSYVTGSTVNAAYGCADALSGVASCVGTVANGAPIDTTGTGTKSFTLTATDKAGNVAQSTVSYTVTVAGPAFTLAPNPLAFGNQTLNVSTTALPISLNSTGSTAVSISSVRVTGTNANQFSETNNCGTSVAAGAACTINVIFRPTSAGSKTASIAVNGGTAATKTVSLTGTGVTSMFTVNPSTIAFASEQTNVASAAQLVTVTNSGTTALPITSISLGGTSANQFSETNTCGTSVPASAACTISVVFKPTSAGAKTATLSVRPGGGAATQTVALSGTGIVPTYTVTPSPLAFVNQAVGVVSASQALTLTNTGTLAVPITTIALSGGNANQFYESNTCGTSVPAGSTCTINVVFRPTTAGAKSTTLRVTPGSGAGTMSVTVTGTGIVPTYSLSPTSLTFGSQARNTSSVAQAITLTNTGTLSLPITSVTLTGGNANQFSQTNTCGTSVAASATCTINVVFKPTSTGTKSATVRVTPGGGASTQSVTANGTGI